MNALYPLLHRSSRATRAAPSQRPTADEPLIEIRPGAFARWIASVEKSDAQAIRHQTATTEGIAAMNPEGAPEPG